jgi:hypothetical protein
LLQARDDGQPGRFSLQWNENEGTLQVPGSGTFAIGHLAERWRRHGLPLMMEWHDDAARGYHDDDTGLWLQEKFGDPDGWPQEPASDLAECVSYEQPPSGRRRCGQRTLWRDDDGQPRCPSPYHEPS